MIDVTDKVNNGRNDCRFNIEAVEKKYNAKYVGQLCLRVKGGGWHGDDCGDIFYQETPPVEGYSNYFAMIIQNGAAYITSGASAVEGIINAVVADDGEIVYSRFRHDYHTSTDGTAFADGGRDYLKCGATNRVVALKIVDGKFYQLDDIEIPPRTIEN